MQLLRPTEIIDILFRPVLRLFRMRKIYIYIFSFLIYLMLTSYLLVSARITDFKTDREITGSLAVQQALEQLKSRIPTASPNDLLTSRIIVAFNLLVNVDVQLSETLDNARVGIVRTVWYIRYDNLILLTGFWIVGTFAIALPNSETDGRSTSKVFAPAVTATVDVSIEKKHSTA